MCIYCLLYAGGRLLFFKVFLLEFCLFMPFPTLLHSGEDEDEAAFQPRVTLSLTLQ